VLAGLNGAPLLNGAGEVVGIVTLQYRPEGWSAVTGDAVGISAGLAAYVAGEIETFGQVRWGWFGATADSTITDRIVLIGVDPGGPAALAGLRSGDAVTHYGGQSLAGVDHLRSLVLATAPGTTVPVGIVRDSLRSDAYVVIGDWSEAFAPASDLSLIEQRAVDQEVLIRMHALIEELNLLMLHPAFDPRRGEVLNRIMRIEREIGEMRRIALPDRPPPP